MQEQLLSRAAAALQQDQLAEAQACYQQLLAQQEAPAALGGMVDLALRVGDFAKAEHWLKRALAAAPESLGPRVQQIDLETAQAHYSRALKASETLLQLTPHPVLHWRSAKNAQALGQWTLAESAYARARAQSPDDTLLQLDALLFQQEQPQPPALPQSVLNTPVEHHSPAVNETLAQLCLAADEPEKAEAWIAPRLNARPPSALALAIQGEICRRSGRHSEAESLLNTSIARVRRNPYAYYWLGLLFTQMQRYSDAIFCLHQATLLRPGLHAAWWQLAELVYHYKHSPEKAFAVYQKAVHFNPASAAVRLKATLCALESQHWEAAKNHLDELADARLSDAQRGRMAALQAWWAAQHQDNTGFQRCLKQARQLAPKDLYTLAMQGQAALNESDFKQAESCWRQVLKITEFPEHYRMQLAEAQIGRHKWAQATKTLEQLLQERPHFIPARERLMEALYKQKRFTEILPHETWLMQHAPKKAEELVKQSLEKDPDNPKAYFNYAKVLQKQDKRQQEALDYVNQTLERDPNHYRAWNLKGNIEMALETFAAAQASFEQAIALQPEENAAYIGLAQALLNQEKWDESLKAAEKAYTLNLNYTACLSLAGILKEMGGQDQQVIALYDKAVNLDPESPVAHWNRSLAILNSATSAEDIQQGMQHYDTGFAAGPRKPYRKFSVPQWQGEPLQGKTLLVWREQGVGDELTAAMHLPAVIEQAEKQGGRVILECTDRFKPLFKSSFPQIEVLVQSGGDDLTRQDIDYHCPIYSLLRVKPLAYPFPVVHTNYARIAEADRLKWQERIKALGSGLKIGLCWRSGMQNASRNRQYARLEELAPLLQLPGVQWVNLVYSNYEQELEHIQKDHGVSLATWDDLDLKNDFYNLAAMMQELDLVISASSLPEVMARFVGVPVWVFSGGAQQPETPEAHFLRWYPALSWKRHYTEDFERIFKRMAMRIQKRDF